MNNRFFLIAILIYLSVQVLGQDVVPRQAPIDNMSSFEDSINNDKGDNSEFTKIPIIIDSTEGWVSTWKVAYLPNGQFKAKMIVTRLPLEKIKVPIRVCEIKNGKLTIHED